MTYCIALDTISAAQRPEVGGKAWSLSAVLRKGLSVPPALVVTTAAYDDFVTHTKLRDRIMMELGRKEFSAMRWEEIWDAAFRIRNIFTTISVPASLREKLSEELRPFVEERTVVIRSSAPGEDSAERSFAGLHESYVGIHGIDAILDHIKLVWASLWSDRALLYRRELGLDPLRSRMAVVIQELVVGEVSGIGFGRHPANPAHRVVEAVYGLNQALVDGSITPDRWTFDRETNRIITHEAGARDRMMIMTSSGLIMQMIADERKTEPPLEESAVSGVATTNAQLEELFDSPQDMEWTMQLGRLVVLQSRPITTSKTGNDDKRSWYLSLTRSFENLRLLRKKIEDDLIPRMIAEAHEMAKEEIETLSVGALAKVVAHRAQCYRNWIDVYWADFIPYAHGIRLFGMAYNDTMRPEDPYEFMGLLAETALESLRRNDLLEAMAAAVHNNPSLRLALRTGLFPEVEFNCLLDEFISIFGDLACGPEACLTGRTAVAEVVLQMAERFSAKRAVSTYPILRERYLASFAQDRRAFAEELLELGRSSYRLRDNDNIYLGRIKMQFIRALETYQTRFGSTEHLKRQFPDIAATVDMLPDNHPIRPTPKVSKLETEEFVSKARQITGQPAGPGIARGTARVITGQNDLFTFRVGEILVCDSIDPTMTFIVPLASAIIERRGGMLIHGAIIAREYGLPCVTGVEDATTVIRTGDVVDVDGYLGIVTIG